MAGFKTNNPEQRAADLRRRFARFSKRHVKPGTTRQSAAQRARIRSRRGFDRMTTILVLLVISAIAAGSWWAAQSRGWSMYVLIKHVAASPNCAAANAVGLAPSRKGEPGYFSRHDRDQDGVSCEVYGWR